MIYRIQKTIICKYIQLVEKDSVSASDISSFITEIEELYSKRILIRDDVFRQKIELILKNVGKDLQKAKRKRSVKEVKLEIANDFYQVLKTDIKGIEYNKVNLSDLDQIEAQEALPITLSNVMFAIENVLISKRKLSDENSVEKHTANHLINIFGKDKVHQQYSIGGFLALKSDIDIGNGQVGIEIKLVDKMTATIKQRLIGQVVYYTKRYYGNNLITVLVGKNPIDAKTTELKEFIEELGSPVIYLKGLNL